MIENVFRVLISVKAKLFFGFAAMTLLLALLGGVAFLSIASAGTVVKDTFDRPLMAINFARSAGQVFGQLQIETLQRSIELNDAPQIEAFDDRFSQLSQTFLDDLGVAEDRSIAERATPFFDETITHFEDWKIAVENGDRVAELKHSEAITTNLDIIIELQSGQSFLERENAIDRMERIKTYNIWALVIALVLTIGLTAWLAITIIRPLKAAATAARKISSGNLNETIPKGGEDETGALLKSMSVMQKNIRFRMEQEQSLRNLAQTRLTDSLTNSQDAIVLTDSDGMIIVANPKVKALISSDDDALMDRKLQEFFHEDGRPRQISVVKTGRTRDNEFKLEDGRWFRVNISNTQDGGQLLIWTEITTAKDRAESLRKARDQAEAADKAKSQFLAAMSHELRTPLNAVIGLADVLNMTAQGRGEEETAELTGLISHSGAHLLKIVEDVLLLSESEGVNRLEMNLETVDLRTVIDFAMKTSETDINAEKLRTVWRRPDTSYLVLGDPVRLQQAILNLINNAIRFNRPEGGIMVRLTEDSVNIRVDVVDTGIGMSDADIKRVRDLFAQADQGHSRKYDGLGIGVNLVDRIVAAHNGTMTIQSQIDYGTTVSLFFPKPLDATNPQQKPIAA